MRELIFGFATQKESETMKHCLPAEKVSSSSSIDQEVEAPALANGVSMVSVTEGRCNGKQAAVVSAAVSSESSSKKGIEELAQCNGKKRAAGSNERAGNQEILSCCHCGRSDFCSSKAFYGHLRSHPERSYRGSKPPPTHSNQYLSSKSPQKSLQGDFPKWSLKRKRASEVDSEMVDAADILVKMSKSENKDLVITEASVEKNKGGEGEPLKEKIKVAEFVRESNSLQKKGAYVCTICNKSLTSYQALGGHKSSHKKIKIKVKMEADRVEGIGPAAADEYRCRVCNKKCASGQALGGHMGAHKSLVAVPPIQINEGQNASRNNTLYDLDLNERAPEASPEV